MPRLSDWQMVWVYADKVNRLQSIVERRQEMPSKLRGPGYKSMVRRLAYARKKLAALQALR